MRTGLFQNEKVKFAKAKCRRLSRNSFSCRTVRCSQCASYWSKPFLDSARKAEDDSLLPRTNRSTKSMGKPIMSQARNSSTRITIHDNTSGTQGDFSRILFHHASITCPFSDFRTFPVVAYAKRWVGMCSTGVPRNSQLPGSSTTPSGPSSQIVVHSIHRCVRNTAATVLACQVLPRTPTIVLPCRANNTVGNPVRERQDARQSGPVDRIRPGGAREVARPARDNLQGRR